MYQTIAKDATFEVTEKKSKFIANLMYIESKADAEDKIKELKKKYYDARHNCFAFRVFEGENIYEKSSDDGEPSGTAGAPMLNILQKNNLCNTLVVVTRYFGGILLGTGGLVRCYSSSTLGAIEIADKSCVELGVEFEIQIDYANFQSFKYYCQKNDINITNTEYMEDVVCRFDVSMSKKEKFLKYIDNKEIIVKMIKELDIKYINV